MERGGEFGRRSEFRPEVGELGSEGQPERPVWAIPDHLFSWPSGTDPDTRPILEDLGLEVLNDGQTIEVSYRLFTATCYQVSPKESGWTRTPDQDGASCALIDPSGDKVLRISYHTYDGPWMLGDFHYGVETL